MRRYPPDPRPWHHAPVSSLRPGQVIVCRETRHDGPPLLFERTVREVWAEEGLIYYTTDGPDASARHVRAPAATVRVLDEAEDPVPAAALRPILR